MNMTSKILSVFYCIMLILLLFVPAITAAAAGDDVDIGALICDAEHASDWKVSGARIDRSDEGYVRVSAANTVMSYSAHKFSDETMKLRFQCKLDSRGGWVALMLRADDPSKVLWTAEQTYGLLFRSSSVELQRWKSGVCTSLALVNFSVPENESFNLRFSAKNENSNVVLTVIINDEEVINFTDTDPITDSGYFSIMASDENYIDVFEDSDQPSIGAKVPLIYFTGCYDEDGSRFIHWRYNGAYKSFTGVEISGEDGSKLAELSYPADRYDLPGSYKSNKIYVTPVTNNGVQREPVEISTIPQEPEEASCGRIAIISSDDGAYFYDTKTGEPFIPCGVNYVRLRNNQHSTFEAASSAGPADYDPYDTEAALKTMSDNGMNTVRVFIVGRSSSISGIAGNPDTPDLYTPYMDNIADFITRAKRYGIYVILIFGCELPGNDHYMSTLYSLPQSPNTLYLTSQGVEAYATYICDVLNYLKFKDTSLLDGLLGVELQNEVALYTGEWPFDEASKSTKVTGTDGRIYDMSIDGDRQALADNSMRYYLNKMTDEIKKVDPALLVCEGSFTFDSVYTTPEESFGMHSAIEDTRLPLTAEVLLGTKLDFLDIHFYHGNPDITPGESFKVQYDSILLSNLSPEAQAARSRIPIIMGEFGSFKNVDNSTGKVLETMRDLRAAALDAGLRGMLYWTLDCFEQETLPTLCDSPDLLCELAKFDIQLPKVDIITFPTAEPTAAMPADEAKDNTGNPLTSIPWWVFAVAGGILVTGVILCVFISKKKNNNK